MFKLCLKFIVISLLISNLSAANATFKLCEAAPIDFNKLNVTEWDWNELSIHASTDSLMDKIKNNKEIGDETKLIIGSNILALIDAFRVRNNESEKFRKAVHEYNFTQILECLNFDLGPDIRGDTVSNSKLLNKTIEILETKIKRLRKDSMLLEIRSIIMKELDVIQDKNDKSYANLNDLLHDLDDGLRYRKINYKSLLNKVKNKDWQGALNLTKDPNELKSSLISRAVRVLWIETDSLYRTEPNSQHLKRLRKLLNKLNKKGEQLKNWEQILWTILDRDWDCALKLAEIAD